MPEPESITSLELQIPCGDRPPLGATLTLPAYPRACALILQGSGPHDRDGAMPAFGFRSTLYKRLANELGTRFGIACLRYDKRGHDLPADAPRDYSVTERVADAYAAFIDMESRREISALPRIIVGHSEGGLVAAAAAALAAESPGATIGRVAGVVSLAAPFGNVFRLNQLRAKKLRRTGSTEIRGRADDAIQFYEDLSEKFKAYKTMAPGEFREFALPYLDKGYSGWESYEWLFEHWAGVLDDADPTRYRIPMFVAQGGRDARLPESNPASWDDWCAKRHLASYLFIPDMGHDLNDAKRKAFVLDETLLTGIGDWIATLKTK